jgi:hypothetical protein
MTPPKRVLLQNLVLLEVLSDTPALIVCKRESVFLEQCVYARDATVPAIFKIIQCETTILSKSFLSLEGILGPNSLGVDKLRLPTLNVSVKVWYELILFMCHTSSEVTNAGIGLL